MDYTDITRKTEKELHDMLAEQREILRDLRFHASEGQLKKVRSIREAKKNIAKILTALNNSATISNQQSKDAPAA